MKIHRLSALGFVLALCLIPAPWATARAEDAPAAAEEEEEGIAKGVSYTFDATASYHNVDHAYFNDYAYHWGEGFSRARVNYGLPSGVYFTAGGVVMATVKTDYYETKDTNDGLLDQLLIGLPNIGGSGLSLTVGRQNMTLGDGFLIGDGYRDHFAALWNIPLSFYDGVLATWTKGPHHVTVFGADLSPSFESDGIRPDGIIAGGEAGWSPSEGNELAATFLRRSDNSAIDYNPQAISLRGSHTQGPAAFAGEAVFESGTSGTTDLAGRGGHVSATYTSESRFKPTLKAEYFLFSGDDPATAKYEGYDPWQFGWNDWSNYYVGDLISSTLGSSSDMRIGMLSLGLTLREGTGVRLLAHRFDRDQGDTKPFAYEFDLVVDQSFGENWSAYVMGASANPLDAGKLESTTGLRSAQLFASVSYKFSGKLAK